MGQKTKKVECKIERKVEDYIKDRVQYKINLYGCLARSQKRSYHFFAITIGIFSAAVPVLISFSDTENYLKILATVLSLLVTILVVVQELYKFREHWRNYSLIEINLRKEEMLFSTTAEHYAKEDGPEKRFKLFVRKIETLIETERNDTILMRTNATSNENNDSTQLIVK